MLQFKCFYLVLPPGVSLFPLVCSCGRFWGEICSDEMIVCSVSELHSKVSQTLSLISENYNRGKKSHNVVLRHSGNLNTVVRSTSCTCFLMGLLHCFSCNCLKSASVNGVDALVQSFTWDHMKTSETFKEVWVISHPCLETAVHVTVV